MGIIEFFIIVIVVCVCAAAVWLIQYAAPGTPGIVYKIIWGVAILLILVLLFNALGLARFDPQIPRVR